MPLQSGASEAGVERVPAAWEAEVRRRRRVIFRDCCIFAVLGLIGLGTGLLWYVGPVMLLVIATDVVVYVQARRRV